jgi:hypothetical protein
MAKNSQMIKKISILSIWAETIRLMLKVIQHFFNHKQENNYDHGH